MLNQERLVSTFLELVKIDAPSGGEKEIAERVADKLRAAGLDARVDPLYNVMAKLDGKPSRPRAGDKPLLLNAHIDRVEPARGAKPIVENGLVTSDGTTVLGADDLAGVASILEAVQSIVESDAPHLPLEIAITSQEEVGLVGAKGLDLAQLKAREGFVFDSHGPVGEIILASPSHNLINATVIGRAAHSGIAPEQGIDAIRIAARAIVKMKLGRIDKETSANIGMIKGGSARNIVPEKVELEGEVRSRNPRKLERQTRAMKQALERSAKPYGAKVEFKVERAYNQYKLAKRDQVVKRLANAILSVGREPRYVVSGGGSDANIFNAKRVKCVVTSVGYEQIHTTGEYLPIAELLKATELVIALASG